MIWLRLWQELLQLHWCIRKNRCHPEMDDIFGCARWNLHQCHLMACKFFCQELCSLPHLDGLLSYTPTTDTLFTLRQQTQTCRKGLVKLELCSWYIIHILFSCLSAIINLWLTERKEGHSTQSNIDINCYEIWWHSEHASDFSNKIQLNIFFFGGGDITSKMWGLHLYRNEKKIKLLKII